MTIWRMSCARWIPKAINTHSQFVILIAFPLQKFPRDAHQCYVIRKLHVLLPTRDLETSFNFCTTFIYSPQHFTWSLLYRKRSTTAHVTASHKAILRREGIAPLFFTSVVNGDGQLHALATLPPPPPPTPHTGARFRGDLV